MSYPTVHTQDKRQVTSSSNTNSRKLCWNTNGSCEFYSHCIDSLFPCGEMGFAVAYAERRCKSIRQLHVSEDNCSSCVSDTQVEEWSQAHDDCLQQRLYNLANEYQNKTRDPPTCLRFEKKAFEEIDICYSTTRKKLCSAVEHSTDTALLQQDLSTVARLFRINEYYSSIAERALSENVRSCNHTESNWLADSLLSQEKELKVVFCGAYKYDDGQMSNLETSLPGEAAKTLERPEEQFIYAGPDYDDQCDDEAPSTLPATLDFHFIVWLPEPNDTLPHNLSSDFYSVHSALYDFKMFVHKPLTSNNTCGDGIRQAGELCDTGTYNLSAVSSCKYMTCTSAAEYDCSTEQLQLTVCWRRVCGNGRRESQEQCDDLNGRDRDGCSSNCTIENGYECSTVYNETSTCTIPPLLPSPSTVTPTSTVASPTPTPSLTTSTTTKLYSTHTTRTIIMASNTPDVQGAASSAKKTIASHKLLSLLALLIPLVLLIR